MLAICTLHTKLIYHPVMILKNVPNFPLSISSIMWALDMSSTQWTLPLGSPPGILQGWIIGLSAAEAILVRLLMDWRHPVTWWPQPISSLTRGCVPGLEHWLLSITYTPCTFLCCFINHCDPKPDHHITTNVAHAMTMQLSWHVQIFAAITWSKLESTLPSI